MPAEENAFSLLARPIQIALEERGFTQPTEPQQRAIPLLLEGKNVLLIAPTGTGKTEAAFLPILHMLITSPSETKGIRFIYITPLRALNRDMLERLEWWCNKLDVRISVRHGDTEVRERAKQAISPPEILITTPETLQAILAGFVMRGHLKQVRWVVVDEVHELATDKRGSQLSVAFERLREIAGHDFQMVGLSATIGSPEKVARFLVGEGRSCEIVRVPVARDMELSILYPKASKEDIALAEKLFTFPEVASRLRTISELILSHRSTLLFTNTRSIAEILASRFKVKDRNFPASIHHGSLSKPSRIAAERGLKLGELKGIICTSSLELGIDIGTVDLVIQYNSPRQVTRLVQRVGRSGHRIGGMAKGVIITIDSDDALESAVIARRALMEDLEEVEIPELPLDVLSHQLAGLLMQAKEWRLDQALAMLRKAYPFRNLTMEKLKEVLTFMDSIYPRLARYSEGANLFSRPAGSKGIFDYYFGNLSMIPEEKQYLVMDEDRGEPVGILDESFVAEYGEPGTKFIIRGAAWKITHVMGQRIYVKPLDDPAGAIPSWVGEEIPVPFSVAQEVGELRGFIERRVREGAPRQEISREISQRYPLREDIAARAIEDVVRHVKKGYPVPTQDRILIEGLSGVVLIHACLGLKVNKTIARCLAHFLSSKIGATVGVQQDPYRIYLFSDSLTPEKVFETLEKLSSEDIRRVIVESISGTALFRHRLVHVARKMGVIKKEADVSDSLIKKLVEALRGTPVFEEAVSYIFFHDLDVENSRRVLEKIRGGDLKIEIVRPGEPTPIARVGLEEMGRRHDLIAPKKLRRLMLETAKARLLSEARVFACTRCWQHVKLMKIDDLEDEVRCPLCGSELVGMTVRGEDEVKTIAYRRGKVTGEKERTILNELKKSAELISRYGKAAAIALTGKNLDYKKVASILSQRREISDRLFELIIEAEKEAMMKGFR